MCELMIRRAFGVSSGQFASRIWDGDRTRCGELAMETGRSFFLLDVGECGGTDPSKPVAVRSRPVLRSRIGEENGKIDPAGLPI